MTLRLLLGAEQPIYGVWTRLWCVECGARGRGSHGEVYSMPLGPKNDTSAVALERTDGFPRPGMNYHRPGGLEAPEVVHDAN